MLEPIDPEVERSWIEFNKRFKELIYPTLFQPFGIAFSVAYQVWAFNTSIRPADEDTRDW